MDADVLVEIFASAFAQAVAVERLETGLKKGIGLGFCLSEGDSGFQPCENVEPHRLEWRRVAQAIFACDHQWLRSQRYPHIRLLAACFADEAFRSHTEHGQR